MECSIRCRASPYSPSHLRIHKHNGVIISTMKFIVATVFSGVAAAFVVPSNVLAERATFCGQYDSEVTGTYTVYNDLWGESSATSGSQCTIVNSDTNGVLSWSTSWTWAGGSYSVKSYANAVVSISQQSLSSISSIPTQWTWRLVALHFESHKVVLTFVEAIPEMIWLQMFRTTCSPAHLPVPLLLTKSWFG